jgi:hypothetical protein
MDSPRQGNSELSGLWEQFDKLAELRSGNPVIVVIFWDLAYDT